MSFVFRVFVSASCLVCAGSFRFVDASETERVERFEPTWESLGRYECPEWFRDAKFGIWSHWGPQAVPGQGDWYARKMYIEGERAYEWHLANFGHPSKVGYKDIVPLWKAERFEPDALMERYVRAGAKYFVALAVHHDNFDLWNSKHHRWNAVEMGPRKDIVGLWAQAARRHGLKFGVSEHLERSYNWFNTNKGADKQGPMAGVPYDGANPEWVDFYFPPHDDTGFQYPKNAPEWWMQQWQARIVDLLDQHRPDLLYTDGGVPFGRYGRELMAHFYNSGLAHHGGRQEVVYNVKRRIGGTHGEFVDGTATENVERGTMTDIHPEPWQCDTTVADWFTSAHYKYKTAPEIIHLLCDVVSKNGNLLLNFTQYADGTLEPKAAEILDELAAWMPINGEAIFGTRPWTVFGEGPGQVAGGHFNEKNTKFDARDVRYTRKGDDVFAILLGWPGAGRELDLRAFGGRAWSGRIDRVQLLGHSEDLRFESTPEALRIRLPDTAAPTRHAVALRLQGAGR
jgi:alpha-L-fucosidase